MNRRLIIAFTIAVTHLLPAVATASEELKQQAVASVDRQAERMIDLSQQIWEFAETALHEHQSAAALANYAEEQGFEVERGVAGMPTAFIASYGKGKPIIGIMGEYDALPGLSQTPTSFKQAHEEGAAGHGCGHNLFGPGSLGAAVAIKELIQAGKLKGTIRFYGTPAEEAVGGKLYMVREGLFDDVDIALAWHPDDRTLADTESSQALADMTVTFHGQSAHAAADPWNGRSALDALELFTFALNQMREHVQPTVRMHYVIKQGGDVPNVIPETAVLWLWLRDKDHQGVDDLIVRARKMVEGAAIATGTTGELSVDYGDYEMLVNIEGAKLIQANFDWLGPIAFTRDEQKFAKEIQQATGKETVGLKTTAEPLDLNPPDPQGGSTDVADVSWTVPTLNLSVATAPYDSPWHAWPVVATGGMSIGHKGMVYAAKSLAATMIDLFTDPDTRRAIRKEFNEDRKGQEYEGYLSDGPPPIPED